MQRRPIGKLKAGAACLYRSDKQAGNAFIAAIVKSGASEAEIWPENWPAFVIFANVCTQWSVGMGGATGLRYEAVYPLIDRAAASPQEWDELFEDIRVMEREALSVMNEKD